MGERWETVEELGAARRRFEAAIPGWQPATSYGFGRLVDGRLDLVRVNTPAHPLPGVVLHAELGGDELAVVFAGDPQEPCDDPHVAALRERVA